MGYKPCNEVPIYTSHFTVLFTDCPVHRRGRLVWRQEIWGRRKKCFEELKNLLAVPSGASISFQELRALELRWCSHFLWIFKLPKVLTSQFSEHESTPWRAELVFDKATFLALWVQEKWSQRKALAQQAAQQHQFHDLIICKQHYPLVPSTLCSLFICLMQAPVQVWICHLSHLAQI